MGCVTAASGSGRLVGRRVGTLWAAVLSPSRWTLSVVCTVCFLSLGPPNLRTWGRRRTWPLLRCPRLSCRLRHQLPSSRHVRSQRLLRDLQMLVPPAWATWRPGSRGCSSTCDSPIVATASAASASASSRTWWPPYRSRWGGCVCAVGMVVSAVMGPCRDSVRAACLGQSSCSREAAHAAMAVSFCMAPLASVGVGRTLRAEGAGPV
jgi:hypothetical protein